ncbi:MAG: hypothetical protein RMK57_16080 [Bryobacterales bacterium]|nr:hypothetical protein [Bryobacteraceae bacterium]MDW8356041.1 hypothetical protein [Bryobacterales bacterium]
MQNVTWCLTLLLASAVAASSQASHSHWSKTVTWKLTPVNLPPAGGEFKLVLAGPLDWIAGYRAESRHDISITVGKACFGVSPPPLRMRVLESLSDWPRARLSTAPGWIQVRGPEDGDCSLLLYARVPSGTNVAIEQDGTTLLRAKPDSELMVRNGEVSAGRVRGEHDLVAQMHRLNLPPEREPLARLPDGKYLRLFGNLYVITNKGLRDHLETFQRPVLAGDSRTCCGDRPEHRVAELRIEVDEGGRVSEVKVQRGPAPLMAACETA